MNIVSFQDFPPTAYNVATDGAQLWLLGVTAFKEMNLQGVEMKRAERFRHL